MAPSQHVHPLENNQTPLIKSLRYTSKINTNTTMPLTRSMNGTGRSFVARQNYSLRDRDSIPEPQRLAERTPQQEAARVRAAEREAAARQRRVAVDRRRLQQRDRQRRDAARLRRQAAAALALVDAQQPAAQPAQPAPQNPIIELRLVENSTRRNLVPKRRSRSGNPASSMATSTLHPTKPIPTPNHTPNRRQPTRPTRRNPMG